MADQPATTLRDVPLRDLSVSNCRTRLSAMDFGSPAPNAGGPLPSKARITPSPATTANALGLLHDVLLPSVSLHSGLSLLVYTVSRTTRRVELKDWLWPSGMVLNAWCHGVIYRSLQSGMPLGQALKSLEWTQKLLLGGVTVWGTRLFLRIANRSIQRGKDDPRYGSFNQDTSFWNTAWASLFLPEAIFQSLISLSWSVALTHGATAANAMAAPSEYAGLLHGLAIGLYTAGLGMEVLADSQIAQHKKQSDDLDRSGMFSIVRHPNYLGDTLVHFSFPLLLYANGLFYPISLLGPIANYVFLRFVGGDKENESTQEQRYKATAPTKYVQLEAWRAEKNSFWPSLREVANPWSLALVGIGACGVLAERGLKRFMSS